MGLAKEEAYAKDTGRHRGGLGVGFRPAAGDPLLVGGHHRAHLGRGAPYGAAVEDYCKWANERKLVPGVVFNCVVRDDQYNNANTQRFFEEAVDRFKIPVFLSYATGRTSSSSP